MTLTWTIVDLARGGGVWGEFVRLPSQLGSALPSNLLSEIGAGKVWGGLLVALATTGAVVLGVRGMPWAQIRREWRNVANRGRPSLRMVFIAVACAYLVVAANVLALTNQPYGQDPTFQLVVLHTSISADTSASYLGGEVNFNVSVTDRGTVGAGGIVLTIHLPPGMRLVGPPAFTRGSGCTGNSVLVCNLDFLTPKGAQQASIMFGVQITQPTSQLLTAWASSPGAKNSNIASFNVSVGA